MTLGERYVVTRADGRRSKELWLVVRERNYMHGAEALVHEVGEVGKSGSREVGRREADEVRAEEVVPEVDKVLSVLDTHRPLPHHGAAVH